MAAPDDEYDSMLAAAAASVEAMDRKLTDAKRMLIAAAISADGDLVIHDNAMHNVNLYDWEISRDVANACLRIHVKPTAK